MKFKEGNGWKACYDEERNLYTAERGSRGFYALYEIDKEMFDQLGTSGVDGFEADKLIIKGRQLFEADDDYYTAPYVRVIDDRFNEIAPWSRAKRRYDRHYGKDDT